MNMILDTIANRRRYGGLNRGIVRDLDYLGNTDFSAMKDGKHLIDGDELFALVLTYNTEPESQRDFEAHRKYADLQYILNGREIIYWAPAGELSPSGEYSEEKDIVFLCGEAKAQLQLTSGSYAVFYPEDAHKPNCAWPRPQQVRKVVVKVRLSG
jgi:YhcH/YjgK/YiaL family protein